MGILFIVTIGGAAAQTAPSAPNSNQTTTGRAQNPSAETRVNSWTRSKLDAAKKRWAQNKEKFTDCQKQLGERQKEKRLSLHNQGHFLERCMSRKS